MSVPWNGAAWDEASAHAFGADWLLEELAPSGALGRAARERERAFRPGEEDRAREAIGGIGAAAASIDAAKLASVRAAIAAAPDPGFVLVQARTGGILGDVDLFDLARFLDALAELAPLAEFAAFAAHVPADASELRSMLEPGRGAARSFYIADTFDAELASRRQAAASYDAAYDLARSKLAERIARRLGVERVRDGEFVVMRDAVSGPLPPEVRVLRETPAYLLCEISLDEASLEALTAREAASAQVAEAEERVRARLSRRVAESARELEEAAAALGALDLFAARVAFAMRYRCVVPQIEPQAEIVFERGRYLPLAGALERLGRRYVPISLHLAGTGIVTGPNMGGKTAALRPVGFLAACVALGVPVPAESAAIPLFDEIAWLGIGAHASEDGLLSAFGSEVIAVRSFLDAGARRELVLIDEFARTTSPLEGRALLVALLETLRARGALALAATHLANVTPSGATHFAIGGLANLAPQPNGPLDLATALARIADAMDYRLHEVSQDALPASDAIALAEALGLEPALIARAKALF
jgi:hypothetical protein